MLPMDYFPYELRLFSAYNYWVDDLIHFCMFTTIFILLYRTFYINIRYLLLTTLTLAVSSEVMQEISTNRSASFGDLRADILGILFGLFITLTVERLSKVNQVEGLDNE